MRGERWRRSVWSGLGVAVLCGVVGGGCAAPARTPALTEEEHEQMIARYAAWKPLIDFYAPVARAARRDARAPLPGFFSPIVVGVTRPGKDPWTVYIFGTDETKKKHFIGIEGTRDLEGVRIDTDASLQINRILRISLHPGFDAVARAVYHDLRTRHLLKPGYRVGLTGHSLGGAAAVVLAMYLDRDGVSVDEVVTFGQPRVTDRTGLASFSRLLERIVRVVGCDDVIPFVPPAPYEHSGFVFLVLDLRRFEFAPRDVQRSFPRAILSDVKNKPFHGHLMDTYLSRLAKPRTDPWRYEGEAASCSGG
jgi:hypothetical protein